MVRCMKIPIRAANRRRKKVVNAAGENEREKESEREKKKRERGRGGERERDREKQRKTGRPRAIRGQRCPLPCFAWL